MRTPHEFEVKEPDGLMWYVYQRDTLTHDTVAGRVGRDWHVRHRAGVTETTVGALLDSFACDRVDSVLPASEILTGRSSLRTGRYLGLALLAVGALLLILGVTHLSSLDSQFARAVGDIDHTTLVVCLSGVVSFVVGIVITARNL